jgi:hypothetical protein
MQSRQNAIQAALLRVRRFIADHEATLTSTVDLTGSRKRLDDLITEFSSHVYDQDAHNRSALGETEKQRQLRLALRSQQMAPIAELARRNLQTVPEFKALKMPPRSAKGEAFLGSAKAMADAAAKYKDALVELGLPANALDRFQALLTTFASSIGDRDQHRTQRMGATKGLVSLEQQGRSVLKVLDALVRQAIGGDATLLGTWDGARKVYYTAGGAGKTPTPTPAPTTPATTAMTSASSTAAPQGTAA